ncbi:MAG: hypothetical protein HQK99_06305 [Nitrospirae bacterium]|nr:hypothetical protein [Nitrospirota bacterium]
MADTCWIKDEHGRFIGRRPGCKMEKSGVVEISDNKTNADVAVPDANLEKEAKASGKSVEDDKKSQRALEILRKPYSQWTEEEKKFMKDYDTLIPNPPENPVEAFPAAKVAGAVGLVESILGNIALNVSLDKLREYAEEKFPGYEGPIGIALAALAFGMVRGMSPAEAAKAEETLKKAMLDGKVRKKIGEICDDIAKKGYNTMPDAVKKIVGVKTGDLSAKEAENLTKMARRANSSTNFDGVTTEVTHAGIEHSKWGHGEFGDKQKITEGAEAAGRKVKEKNITPEEQRGNVPLKKEDYQNIEKYRQEAVAAGTYEFQPKGGRKYESVLYTAKQKNGEVVKIAYKVEGKKLTLLTMWKVPPPK